MQRFKFVWLLVVGFVVVVVLAYTFWGDPGLPPSMGPGPVFEKKVRAHLDHSAFFAEPFERPEDVTAACLTCHPDASAEVMKTAHWSWLGEEVEVPGREGKMRMGKKNLLNNFCLGIQGNWASCTKCHAGYGWSDASFDFADPMKVDCLACHDGTGTYTKDASGYPKKGTDLLAVAKGVTYPKRGNCGVCHSFGGGGLGVKHGDLDNSLDNPRDEDDVHMGRHGMQCIDCHTTQKHNIKGRSMSMGVDSKNGIGCTDCHTQSPHTDQRLNTHLGAVACETCHIPTYARRVPTKMWWDWSKAGDSGRKDDPHHYLKIKGEFMYAQDVLPEYLWWNKTNDRYILGDKMDPTKETELNRPRGGVRDKSAKIYPFKAHRATQPYDTVNNTLLQPVTSGEGGYWKEFDWEKALRLGAQFSGVPFSGKYGFAKTVMYWPLSHMVLEKGSALSCDDCHGTGGRLDWRALGYPEDPILGGGRP